MTAFADRGPVPVEGRCLWCGGKLRRWGNGDGVGYAGRGRFCTLTCGFSFGSQLAENGRRLTTRRTMGDPSEATS